MIDLYIKYIIEQGINLQKGRPVEIIGSIYIQEFINKLKHACLKKGASSVYITYIDSNDLKDKIEEDYSQFIHQDIEKYQKLISEKFSRIIVQSPFLVPFILSNKKRMVYNECLKKLNFVNEYFDNQISSKTICLSANPYWASKLNIKEEMLWEIIIKYSLRESKLEKNKESISNLKLEKLFFRNSSGTNLEVQLTNNFVFQGKNQYTIDRIRFQPNIPCLELYTAPMKYNVNGTIVSSKGLYYKGIYIKDFFIQFLNGKIVSSKGLKEILSLHPNIFYMGEISLVETIEELDTYSMLLNENFGCHFALGNAYKHGIKEIESINVCPYHIDLTFGTKDIEVIGTKGNNTYILIKNGKFIYEKAD